MIVSRQAYEISAIKCAAIIIIIIIIIIFIIIIISLVAQICF